jgi:chemotaxis protein CheX
MDIASRLIDATIEIFTTMVMMEITAGEPIVGETHSFKSSTTGMIGLAGLYKGMLAIHVPDEVAIAITSGFLGMEVKDVNEDVLDAVGELTNMLGGSVKGILSENGRDIELSLPSTISGQRYNFQCKEKSDIFVIPFTVADKQQFLVELQLQGT